jgi:hypothetical protein
MRLAHALLISSMAASSRHIYSLGCLDGSQTPLQQHLGGLLPKPLLLLVSPSMLVQLQRRQRDDAMAYPCGRKPAKARARTWAEKECPQ